MKGGREKPKKEREGERRKHREWGRERKREMRAVKREEAGEGNLGKLFDKKKRCSQEKTEGRQTWF